MHRYALSAFALALLAGCGKAPPPAVAVAPTVPPPPVLIPAPMPAGARAGMMIPPRRTDGTWATPNRDLSAAGTIWHLRAALNVAALACRGPREATMVAQYNALLAEQKTGLAAAEATLANEFRATVSGDWRDRYDDDMTRLYSFFAQDMARDGFCRAAEATLTDAQGLPAERLAPFAAERLPGLERPFTDFFTAYDRWRSGMLVPAPRAAPPVLRVDIAALG